MLLRRLAELLGEVGRPVGGLRFGGVVFMERSGLSAVLLDSTSSSFSLDTCCFGRLHSTPGQPAQDRSQRTHKSPSSDVQDVDRTLTDISVASKDPHFIELKGNMFILSTESSSR